MLRYGDCRRAAVAGLLLPDRESSGRLDVVPVLLREGVGLLLKTLLALRETLVLADSHDCDESCVGVEALWLVVVIESKLKLSDSAVMSSLSVCALKSRRLHVTQHQQTTHTSMLLCFTQVYCVSICRHCSPYEFVIFVQSTVSFTAVDAMKVSCDQLRHEPLQHWHVSLDMYRRRLCSWHCASSTWSLSA